MQPVYPHCLLIRYLNKHNHRISLVSHRASARLKMRASAQAPASQVGSEKSSYTQLTYFSNKRDALVVAVVFYCPLRAFFRQVHGRVRRLLKCVARYYRVSSSLWLGLAETKKTRCDEEEREVEERNSRGEKRTSDVCAHTWPLRFLAHAARSVALAHALRFFPSRFDLAGEIFRSTAIYGEIALPRFGLDNDSWLLR